MTRTVRGVALAAGGGLFGLYSLSRRQHEATSAVDDDVNVALVKKPTPFIVMTKAVETKFEFKTYANEAKVSLLLSDGFQFLNGIADSVRFDRINIFSLLFPSLAASDGGSNPSPFEENTSMAMIISSAAAEGDKQLSLPVQACSGKVSSIIETTTEVADISNTIKTRSTCEEDLHVVLFDSLATNDSIIVRGCHVLFSWGIFATIWSSVLAFPIFTLWTVFQGAWTTVASTAALWLLSLFVRLPSSNKLRRLVFQGLHKWFPRVDIIYEQEPPLNKTIFCAHPHGIFSIGTAMLLDDLNYRQLEDGTTREVVIVAAPFLRWGNPVFKSIADLMGIHVHGAGRNEFRTLLDSGTSCALVPGGFSEATISCVGKERVYINDRKGFVKYALRAGYSLTPVYVFGETDLYHNPQGLMQQRLHMNTFTFQIPGVLPFGYHLAPLAPRRVPLRVVCGRPLALPTILDPTEEEVTFHHARYVEALQGLYNRHAEGYHTEVLGKYGDMDIGDVANNAGPRVLERW